MPLRKHETKFHYLFVIKPKSMIRRWWRTVMLISVCSCNTWHFIIIRGSLQVADQMRLLHSCWSELLLLDHVCRQLHHGREETVLLVTGEEVGWLFEKHALHSLRAAGLHTAFLTSYSIFGPSPQTFLYFGLQIEMSSILNQSGPPLINLVQRTQELVKRLQVLQMDRREMACFKFLILFNQSKKCFPAMCY